jgi:branched-chain amino acid transport system ATP-binding protein
MDSLTVDELVKTFGGIMAVDHVSFGVDEGSIIGIIGPNGAGKTTLFNLISGIYNPDSGQVRLSGDQIDSKPPHKVARMGLGRTFQISRPFGQMTVHENLRVANYNLPKDQREERIERVMDMLDLTYQEKTNASDLSGGQQTLLDIGRVLMLDPKIVLMDEPAAGVNPKLVDRIANLIEETSDERTYLLVEHDITLISRLCERVIVLNQGEKIADGPIDEIKNDDRVREAYLG